MKKMLLLAALIGLATGLWADQTQVLVLPVPRTLSSIPVLELDGRNYAGFTLKTEFFDDHAIAFANLLAGKTSLLMTGFTQGAYHAFDATDIVHLRTPVWGVSSLVALDPKLKNLADFAGQTILVPFAKSPLELQLLAILRAQGLEGKVKLDYSPIPQQIPLLLQKKVAGVCIPEPLVSKLVTQNGAREVATFGQLWAPLNGGNPNSPQVSLFARTDRLTALRPAVTALLADLAATTAEVQKDPAAAATKWATTFGLPADLLARGLKNTTFDLPTPAVEKQLIEAYFRLLGEKRTLPAGFFAP